MVTLTHRISAELWNYSNTRAKLPVMIFQKNRFNSVNSQTEKAAVYLFQSKAVINSLEVLESVQSAVIITWHEACLTGEAPAALGKLIPCQTIFIIHKSFICIKHILTCRLNPRCSGDVQIKTNASSCYLKTETVITFLRRVTMAWTNVTIAEREMKERTRRAVWMTTAVRL